MITSDVRIAHKLLDRVNKEPLDTIETYGLTQKDMG